MDIECYQNYFLVGFKAVDSRKTMMFDVLADAWNEQLTEQQRATIISILRTYQIVTFNGLDYDMPMLTYALKGATCAQLKQASDHIIMGNLRSWQFEQEYGFKVPAWIDHIDLKEPVPGVQISLKLYGGRLHSKRLQDLPYQPDALLNEDERQEVRTYNENDLDTTIDLWLKARDPKDDIIGTRELLTAEFGVDVRSKSDAQIAEAIIRARVEKLKGDRVYKQDIRPGTVFCYKPPAWLRFSNPLLVERFQQICAAQFIVKHDGTVLMPDALGGKALKIGSSAYKMGIGGLHSTEKSQAVIGSDKILVRDIDVVSYYPSLILQCGLFPENMGKHFQMVYNDFFVRRVSAKKAGHKSTAQTLKIFLNGTFGKLGSPYSVLYAPNLLIQVTVTGQLALLMLIERFEASGIPVVSANTDGVVQACPIHLDPIRLEIVKQWERETGLETEETKYRALFSRDVNNYLALKDGGGVKTKGVLADPGVMKNPANVIVSHAVCEYLDKGVPIAQTIIGCNDIRKFLTVKRVTGGAQWRGQYLGKVVRWYRGADSTDPIFYGSGAKEGHKVGGSDNAVPAMELPNSVPADIDYDFYITEARDLLREIGAI